MFAATTQALRFLSARLRLAGHERGATAVEYGIMVALIAVVIILTVTALGQNLDTTFGTVRDALPVGGAGGSGS